MGYWLLMRNALIALLAINLLKTVFYLLVQLLIRLRNYQNLKMNFAFGLDLRLITTNKKKLKCFYEGGNHLYRYRWHTIQMFGFIFLTIALSTFFVMFVYDEAQRIQNVDNVQKHRREKEKDFLDMVMWKTENEHVQTENRCYHLLAKSKRLSKKLRQQIYQKAKSEMKNGSVSICAEMDPTCPKFIVCHHGETKKFIYNNSNDCSYLFDNFQDGRIFQGNYRIMVLVLDEIPGYIHIGNTRDFDRDSGNQRRTENQDHVDVVPTVDLNLHRTNNLRSLQESSGISSLSLYYDDNSGIENASLQHSISQNRDFPMSNASGQQLRHTLSSGYQSGRRRYFSSGQHSFSLGQIIAEVNEEPNSNVNHTSLNSEANHVIDILENNAAQCSSNFPHQEAVESENLSQQGDLSQERGDCSNHQVSTNVRPTGTRDLDGEHIQSDTNTITIHNTETKTRSNDHSELSSNTPSQCLRNTSLFPTPLMNSVSHTPSQCSRNTSLFPTPLVNSESHTPSQSLRNTRFSPMMNSELPESQYEKNSVPFVERFSQQLPVSVTSNKENTPADSPIVAVSTKNIQTNEPEIHSDLSGNRVNLYQAGRQFGTNDRMEEKLDYTQSIVCEDKFCLPVSDDIDDIDEDQLFGDGSTGLTELSVDTGTDDDDENKSEEDSCAFASENQKPGKDPDYKM
ncbi:uncharacterized protein LOC127725310 [Mytilus californianus]|uniref:uncharacterized protein LOC127725310 n=1 Tax=Mytilus californianus TaxID=6549 RepID=UPI0022454645|nr:uncharacterized protein LOC127725310 [Mytilus californianus]